MSDLAQFSEQPKPPNEVPDSQKSDAARSSFLPPNKKIFVFCDGTGNEFSGLKSAKKTRDLADRQDVCADVRAGKKSTLPDGNSNVVKLYTSLDLNPGQIAYYHPGVGTMGDPTKKGIARLWSKIKGLAFGFGFEENVLDAYRYLMQHYNAGDTVYIFGFSRGSYTARALAGLLQGYGLLCRGNEGHILYAWQLYKNGLKKARGTDQKSAEGHTIQPDYSFRDTFSHADFTIHFMGLWDTVSSVGWITTPVRLLHLAQNPSFAIGRHAISIDERRCFYHDNLWGDPIAVQVPPILQGTTRGDALNRMQDIVQVWFPGVHSDVGGSYPQLESGLANHSLKWMMSEVEKAGAVFNPLRRRAIFGEAITPLEDPNGLTAELQPLYPVPQCNDVHRSMKGAWWFLEIFPHRFYDTDESEEKLRIPWGGWRHLPKSALLHPTVVKLRQPGGSYDPPNLKCGTIEPIPDKIDGVPQKFAGYGLYTRTQKPADWRANLALVLLAKVLLASIPIFILYRPIMELLRFAAARLHGWKCTWLRDSQSWTLPPDGLHRLFIAAQHGVHALGWSLIAAAALVVFWELFRLVRPRS
jgi:uncharacterized protein (DUF2235 family)